MPPARKPPHPLVLGEGPSARNTQWWQVRSPEVVSPVSPTTPMSLSNLLNPLNPASPVLSPPSPPSPTSSTSSVQYISGATPLASRVSKSATGGNPASSSAWVPVTIDDVDQLQPSDSLHGKSFLTLTQWWTPEQFAPVKAYLKLSGARITELRRARNDIQAEYVLLPMHMQNVPMAMMHIEGVTPEWVFKCAKARGLPRVIHGKLETLHLNEDRAPVRPVPRPIVSFPVNRGGKSFQGTWARPEVIDEVVTCLHEFALDVSSRMGIPVSDMPNSDAGFASWWATKFPGRPPFKAVMLRQTKVLEERCEWLKIRNTRKRERDTALLTRLVGATRGYDWNALTSSVTGFWKYWDKSNWDAPSSTLGRFEKQLVKICPDFRRRRYILHPYRNTSRTDGEANEFLEQVVQAMNEFFDVDGPAARRSSTKEAFFKWWKEKYPTSLNISRFCRDNEEILSLRSDAFRNRWRSRKPKSLRDTTKSFPKSAEFIEEESDEEEEDPMDLDTMITAAIEEPPTSAFRCLSPAPERDYRSSTPSTPAETRVDPSSLTISGTHSVSALSPRDSLFSEQACSTPQTADEGSPCHSLFGSSPSPSPDTSFASADTLSRPPPPPPATIGVAQPTQIAATPCDSLFGPSPAPHPMLCILQWIRSLGHHRCLTMMI